MRQILGVYSAFLIALMLASSPVGAVSGIYQGNNSSQEEIKMAHLGDIDVAYKILGNQSHEPLVMIMGFDAGMDLWDPRLLKDLAVNNQVMIFDNRGMGFTADDGANFSIADLSNDTLGLMDALNIDKANILGYSMGTFVAQELALRNPKRVNKLMLYAGDCISPSPKALDIFINNSGDGSWQEKAMKRIEHLVPEEWLSQDAALCDWFFDPKENLSSQSVNRQLWAMESWPGTGGRMGLISAPTLVATGTEDAVIPKSGAFNLTSGIEGSWLVQFKGGGHGLMYQYPGRLAEVVDDFFELA